MLTISEIVILPIWSDIGSIISFYLNFKVYVINAYLTEYFQSTKPPECLKQDRKNLPCNQKI